LHSHSIKNPSGRPYGDGISSTFNMAPSIAPEVSNATAITPFHASSDLEPPSLQKVIDTLGLQPHIEGGYFVKTDKDQLRIPSPFVPSGKETRSAGTTIYYLITPKSPLGAWHRNKAYHSYPALGTRTICTDSCRREHRKETC